MMNCPLTRQACEDPTECRFAIKLEDFHGCPLDLAEKAIQDFKLNTLIPGALKLDGIVRKILTGGNQ